MVGSVGTADPMAGIRRNAGVVPGGVDGAGDDLFPAGLAGGVFCESRFEGGPMLEIGGRGTDAGSVLDDPDDCFLRVRHARSGAVGRDDGAAYYIRMGLF